MRIDNCLLRAFKRGRLLLGAAILIVTAVWCYRGSVSFLSRKEHSELSDSTFYLKQAYANRWVGFPELYDTKINCKTAIVSTSPEPNTPPSRAKRYQVQRISPAELARRAGADCEHFLSGHGFLRYPPPSRTELEFPLAFTLIFHDDLDQLLYLLRAIYRPHNVYCLHVDKDTGSKFIDDVKTVTQCFQNVFVAKELFNVVYEDFSRLQADLSCMRELLRHGVQWKYLINMAGKEFPLKTNLEMVSIIRQFNGTSNIESLRSQGLLPRRYVYKYFKTRDPYSGRLRMTKDNMKNNPVPHGLRVHKGSAYFIASRAFIEFALENQVSNDLLRWSQYVLSPDEYVWATLVRAQGIGVPGGYDRDKVSSGRGERNRVFLAVYVSWAPDGPCKGLVIRDICIFALADLPNLVQRKEFLANKFYISRDPTVLHCLDQLIYNLTVSKTVRDIEYYKHLHYY